MAWVLRAGGEHTPAEDSGIVVWLGLEVGGGRWGTAIAPRDWEKVARVLEPYVAEAEKAVGDSTQIARVRRWARANGYVVADRGRVPVAVLRAYNATHRPTVQDRSGRQRRNKTLMSEIEQLRFAPARHLADITTSAWVVGDGGQIEPLHDASQLL